MTTQQRSTPMATTSQSHWFTTMRRQHNVHARRTGATPSRYRLRATNNVFAEGRWQTTFSTTTTHTIYIGLDIPAADITGMHRHRVVIYAPAGWEYQAVDQAVNSTEMKAGDTERRVWCAVPVAETLIQDYAIYGEWRAAVIVDNVERASLSFTITV